MRDPRVGSTAIRVAWAIVVAAVVLDAVHVWARLSPGVAGAAAPVTINDFHPVLPLLGFSIVGLLIIRRFPRHVYGWIACEQGLAAVVPLLFRDYALAGALHPGLPAAPYMQWTGSWLGLLVTINAPLTFYFLPNGSLPSRRWRPLLAVSIAILVGFAVAAAIAPGPPPGMPFVNPFGIPGSAPTVFHLLSWFWVVFAVIETVAFTSLIARFRISDYMGQQQLRPLVALGWTSPASFWLVAAAMSPGAAGWLVAAMNVIGPFGVLTFPPALAIAVFRYRLYDADVVINRAVVYGSLAALITGVYVGIAVGLGELVGSGGRPNLGLSILATAIVAIGFQPARERLQHIANRLVYGRRATPYQVLSEFSHQVAESYAADEVLTRMARVLKEGTAAESASVWLRSGGVVRPAAWWPADAAMGAPVVVHEDALPELPGVTLATEVRHQHELLGALCVTKRRGETLTPVENKLVSDLANQAGLVLKNVGLTAELLQRIEDLRTSRQRLVAAQDEERRRLERNLHDGAQQNLVALKVKLSLAERFADTQPEKVVPLVQQLKAEADETLETLRALAHGIYPPLLAANGLTIALETQARKATLPVTVCADGLSRYPQPVEAAVYFCVLEALQNVQKYASASQAQVTLAEAAGELRFEVVDDGRGFDPATAQRGAGLQNIEDRVSALGGALEVSAAVGQGARIAGSVRVQVEAAGSDQ